MYRVTTFFSWGNYGFSETWWHNATTVQSLDVDYNPMMMARCNMLTADVRIVGVRVAVEGAPRTGTFYLPGVTKYVPTQPAGFRVPYGGTQDPANFYGQGETSDQVKASLIFEPRLEGRSLGRRYLPGFPDKVSRAEVSVTNFTDPAAWWTAYNAWSLLIIGKWRVKGLLKTGAGAPVDIKSFRLSDDAPSRLGVVVPGNQIATYTPPKRVKVRGVRMRYAGLESPNRVWEVESTALVGAGPDTVLYLLNSEGFDAVNFKTKGTVSVIAYDYFAPTILVPYKVSTHQRGGPSPRPLGRRRVQKYAPR